ncbi:MAG TPA: bis(5'-nucleosyl)-tetraphosphatase (symmetrical) YqeK [Clostridia bacterium]|nr:bis(5'-nucleosyl)-tetraphosphatase (symmetrical) YqeK [Clostridia bacterium]
MDKKQIIDRLSEMLEPKRLQHSIRVMECAERLARLHGVDEDKAVIAGLLHDCAKGFSGEALIERSKEYGIELDEISLYQRGLIHGPLGAGVASRVFGIEDLDILSAIEHHTYGKKDMDELEMVIYLADLVEPGRTFEGVDELRALASEDLEGAMLKALDDIIALVMAKGGLIHPNTLEARNSIILNKLRFGEEICCH